MLDVSLRAGVLALPARLARRSAVRGCATTTTCSVRESSPTRRSCTTRG